MMAHEPLAHLSNLYRLTLAQAYFNDRKWTALLLVFLPDRIR